MHVCLRILVFPTVTNMSNRGGFARGSPNEEILGACRLKRATKKVDLEVYWNYSIYNLCEHSIRDVMHQIAWFCGAGEFSASKVVVVLEEFCETNYFVNLTIWEQGLCLNQGNWGR